MLKVIFVFATAMFIQGCVKSLESMEAENRKDMEEMCATGKLSPIAQLVQNKIKYRDEILAQTNKCIETSLLSGRSSPDADDIIEVCHTVATRIYSADTDKHFPETIAYYEAALKTCGLL